jgi:hypothetical protein
LTSSTISFRFKSLFCAFALSLALFELDWRFLAGLPPCAGDPTLPRNHHQHQPSAESQEGRIPARQGEMTRLGLAWAHSPFAAALREPLEACFDLKPLLLCEAGEATGISIDAPDGPEGGGATHLLESRAVVVVAWRHGGTKARILSPDEG